MGICVAILTMITTGNIKVDGFSGYVQEGTVFLHQWYPGAVVVILDEFNVHHREDLGPFSKDHIKRVSLVLCWLIILILVVSEYTRIADCEKHTVHSMSDRSPGWHRVLH